jgi:hypothetical protein
MEWLTVFAIGTLTGGILCLVARASFRLIPRPSRIRQTFFRVRFKRTFGIAPSRDEDVTAMLQPVITQHVYHLHEQALRAAKQLDLSRATHPPSFLTCRDAVASLLKAKARKQDAERQLAVAIHMASLWNFTLAVPVKSSNTAQTIETTTLKRVPSSTGSKNGHVTLAPPATSLPLLAPTREKTALLQ